METISFEVTVICNSNFFLSFLEGGRGWDGIMIIILFQFGLIFWFAI